MPKNECKLRFVLLMILSVFLLFTGCGRNGREIAPIRETAEGSGTEKEGEEEQSEKTDPNKEPAGKNETTVPARENPDSKEQGSENFTSEDRNLHNEKTVVVHVCGAVNQPGIYTLSEGSRLWEAVEAAGGVTEDGAGDYLNMAATVSDGEKVVVPFLADVEEPFGEAEIPLPWSDNGIAGTGSSAGGSSIAGNSSGSAGDSGTSTGLVELNTAGLEQLLTLPGIGESKAKAILEYREKTGPFTVPEDITNVPGIKEGSYEKLKDYITVR